VRFIYLIPRRAALLHSVALNRSVCRANDERNIHCAGSPFPSVAGLIGRASRGVNLARQRSAAPGQSLENHEKPAQPARRHHQQVGRPARVFVVFAGRGRPAYRLVDALFSLLKLSPSPFGRQRSDRLACHLVMVHPVAIGLAAQCGLLAGPLATVVRRRLFPSRPQIAASGPMSWRRDD
jgi:hypothetical protein